MRVSGRRVKRGGGLHSGIGWMEQDKEEERSGRPDPFIPYIYPAGRLYVKVGNKWVCMGRRSQT